jgi:hypothetical protein
LLLLLLLLLLLPRLLCWISRRLGLCHRTLRR